MWAEWQAIWTPPNVALAIFGSVIAALLLWAIPRLVRVSFNHAWSFTKREVGLIEVALSRYRSFDGFERVTFQNYISTQVRKTGVDTWFDAFMMFGLLGAASAALEASKVISIVLAIMFAIFLVRLVVGTMKHVRFLLIEEELYRHVALENTERLNTASGDTNVVQGTAAEVAAS